MNTRSASMLLTAALLGGAVLQAADCCCPAGTKSNSATAALPGLSIYQLGATWTTDLGRPFQLAGLRGRPVVLAMFFTSCGYACPRIVADMTHIRDTLPAGVRSRALFVLVSFDDRRDTVPVLHAYRAAHDLPASSWVLLRGAPDDIRELAAVLGVKYQRDANGMFEHSNLITILNPEGEIVHQRAGLEGGLAAAAQAVVASR